MTDTGKPSQIEAGARAIYAAFESYQTQFRIITRRAEMRFENRDWHGMQSDAAERLGLYQQVVDPLISDLKRLLASRLQGKEIWAGMKNAYSGGIADRTDRELAETFFNSVTRRVFTTVGVDPLVEFVDTDFSSYPPQANPSVFRTYSTLRNLAELSHSILSEFPLGYEDIQRDSRRVAEEIAWAVRGDGQPVRAEMVRAVFYRGKGAYIVGRIVCANRTLPIALSLLQLQGGIAVDAALLTEDEVSILFSFTRSYFHVNIDPAFALVQFLKSIMPRKPVSELYISIGRNKHGKTELYRELLRHLEAPEDQPEDQFAVAPGARGMVMAVFTLPSFEVVFKVIKDRFDDPKTTTRPDVMNKYRLVFAHDRAGRLVDAQEFEHLKFDRARFSPSLLEELRRVAQETVVVEGESVVIKHLYTERRLIPLDVYLRSAEEEEVHAAVIDYGNAIKDLARANIFTGDVLAKNFGVTRHGRIVSYDYDELCLLTDCNFRTLPPPQTFEEEFAGEPWFHVAENDYFPEEFESFFGLTGPLRELFRKHHGDLFGTPFWHQIQNRIESGEVIHIFPYPAQRRMTSGPLS